MKPFIVLTLLLFASHLSPGPASAQPNGSSESRSSGSSPSDSGSATVDLNRADVVALTQLPGIGPSLAERIVAYRNKRPFQSKRDLRRVKGIGFHKYTRIAPLVTVGSSRVGKRPKSKRPRVQR